MALATGMSIYQRLRLRLHQRHRPPQNKLEALDDDCDSRLSRHKQRQRQQQRSDGAAAAVKHRTIAQNNSNISLVSLVLLNQLASGSQRIRRVDVLKAKSELSS